MQKNLQEIKPKSFRLPPDIVTALNAEAKVESRDCTKQLIHILKARYAKRKKQ